MHGAYVEVLPLSSGGKSQKKLELLDDIAQLLLCVLLLVHRMESEVQAPSLLLALPDPCLLTVLQCCAADDYRSLFNAARSHSRLHQAAAAALCSIRVVVTPQQQQPGSVLMYLRNHGHFVDSITLRGWLWNTVDRPHLAANLQLRTLHLIGISNRRLCLR
jgi:hypothetical protein